MVLGGFFLGTTLGGGLGGGGGVVIDASMTNEEVASVVFEDIDDFWSDYARGSGSEINDPSVGYVYLDTYDSASSGCGAVYGTEYNAYYCPNDDTIYITETFIADARATAGVAGIAYTVAHEYGHNVADEYGAGGMDNPGAELYADYLAGVYMADAVGDGDFTVAESQSAVGMAGDIGDYDTGAADHHGTPYQRQEAFVYGYNTRSVSQGYEVYSGF
jgi:predicted metalloprotease